MFRKIAILISVFFLCLGLNDCKSPVEPEKRSSLYRYSVEVVYSDVAKGESDFPLFLYYGLHETWGGFNSGYIEMNKIGEKLAICYLPKVLITTGEGKHWVSVVDPNKQPWCHRGENIDIEGAYDLEITTSAYCSQLLFKMSKE